MLDQGVTTLVVGNCGLSPDPVRPQRRSRLARFAGMCLDAPLDWAWETMDGYLSNVHRRARP